MINPFISNNDQFLFRKNYQLLNKPEAIPPTTTLTNTDSNLRSLQYRNPFTSHSPNINLRNSSVASPQRPNSLSRVTSSNPQPRFGAKGGILDSMDGWKRQIESQERQKLHIYGAEGLRYNAFMEERPRLNENEYYNVVEKPRLDIKPPSFQKLPSNESINNYYQPPRVQVLPQKVKQREHFEDEVFQSPNFHLVDPRQRDSNSRSNSSKNSKINDMFDSEFDDRCKKSMQYNSYYGGGGTMQDEMLESRKGNFLGSRFRDSSEKYRESNSRFKQPGHLNLPRSMSMESQVHHFDVPAPPSISIQGRMYYRINV